MNMNSAIILAAGNGLRFNEKKQFKIFRNKKLWEHVYDKVKDLVNETIVVGIDIKGGKTRSESVINGLNSLSKNSNRVIILEAARPLVTNSQIEILLNSSSDSCGFYSPFVDATLVDDNIYYDRSRCKSFQAPQAFNTKLLKEAYNSNKYLDNVGDETIIMYKHFNINPTLYLGGPNLFKVTYPEDLDILNVIIKQYNIEI